MIVLKFMEFEDYHRDLYFKKITTTFQYPRQSARSFE